MNLCVVEFLDHLAYTWFSRTSTSDQSVKVVTDAICFNLFNFPTFVYSPLLAFISQAAGQLASQRFVRLIGEMALRADHRATEVEYIHRFWGSHDLMFCVTVISECKAFGLLPVLARILSISVLLVRDPNSPQLRYAQIVTHVYFPWERIFLSYFLFCFDWCNRNFCLGSFWFLCFCIELQGYFFPG